MEQLHKPHRKSKEKKTQSSGERNPKAFAFARPGKLQRTAARSSDVCLFLSQLSSAPLLVRVKC